MAGQMFSKNNFKNLFLLFFIICQFGAIVSDSHIWDWGVYLALNILIVLYVYLRPGEARTKSSQQKLLIAVLIHTAVIISTLWRAYRVSFIMDIFFDILDFWAIWGFILILKFGLSKKENGTVAQNQYGKHIVIQIFRRFILTDSLQWNIQRSIPARAGR